MISYLKRSGKAQYQSAIWFGVVTAALLSLISSVFIFNVLGGYDPSIPSDKNALRLFEGVSCLIAAVVLSWMIIWMSRQGKHMSGEIRQAIDSAVSERRATQALFGLAFLTVGREGFETIIILPGMSKGTTSFELVAGVLLGLGLSSLIGISLAKGSRKLDIRKLFQVSGILLIFFAAGLVAYGIHELQDAGVFPVIAKSVWDINHLLNEKEGVGLFLKTLFGYNGNPELVEVCAYFTYLLTSLFLFLKPVSISPKTQSA